MLGKPKLPTPNIKKKKSQAEEIDQLMEYLKQGGSLGLEIEKSFEDLPDKYVVLLVTRQEKYDLLITNLVKNFRKKEIPGIFVTLNKGGEELIKMLQENQVDCNNVMVIDAISKKGTGKSVQEGQISYVDSPNDLTEIHAQITDFAETMPAKNRFLIFDSLSTLLIYNTEKTVEKFVHHLGESTRSLGFQTVFTIMDKTKPQIMNVLSQFCDKIIKLSPQIKP